MAAVMAMVMATVRMTTTQMAVATAMVVPSMFTTTPAMTVTMWASLLRRQGRQWTRPSPLPIKGTTMPAAMKIPPPAPPLPPPLPPSPLLPCRHHLHTCRRQQRRGGEGSSGHCRHRHRHQQRGQQRRLQ